MTLSAVAKASSLGCIVRQVDRDGQLVAAHVGDHDGNAHGSDAPDRHPQQRNGQRQRTACGAGRAQQLFIAVQHLVKQQGA